MPTLENWYCEASNSDSFCVAVTGVVKYVYGTVSGHATIADGTSIRTPQVSQVNSGSVVAGGVTYTLGEPSARYTAWCESLGFRTPSGGAGITTSNISNLFSQLGGTANSITYLRGDGTWATPVGAGTVLSVGLSLPAELNVSNSPVTTTGTLTAQWATATQNHVFAAPFDKTDVPGFRALVASDLPTHNAATATALQTGRTINGVSFDGTSNITVPAAAGTLTGATLAAGVTASSLTSFGSSPTIVTPTIASFANAGHNHQNAAGGGSLDAAAIGSGTIAAARLGSGSGGSSKFLREDSTWQTIAGGGDALTSGTLAQFASTTSAQLGGIISDKTGSGALVFGTTPTLTSPVFAAGSGSANSWPKMSSGTVLTSAEAGALEYDGRCFYMTSVASARQVVATEQFICLTGNYTLTSQVATQKLFNSPANGAVTLQADTTYLFEGFIHLASMSGTSGNALLSISGAGTATISSIKWAVMGADAATLTAGAACSQSMHTTAAASGNIFTAGTGTNMWAFVKGIVRVNAGGTFIPSIGLTTAAAAVVQQNSYFRFMPVGTGSVASVGNWS